ncbi:MAG: histidine phosphatase family protein [Ilumatobacteraceae bacterium]
MSETEFTRTRLVLIRHGESIVTVRRIIGGPLSCVGLSDLGRQQAERLGERLRDTGELGAATLYSSAYPRAIETAELIAPSLAVELCVDERFGEHDPGPDCDGMSFAAFLERYGRPDWHGDPYAETFPGGETLASFHHRIGSALADVIGSGVTGSGGTIVIVCHGGVVDAVFRQLLRLPSTGGFELQASNTSLTEFVMVKPGMWRLARFNDAAHLAGLPLETPR